MTRAYERYKAINEKHADNVECLRYLVDLSRELGFTDEEAQHAGECPVGNQRVCASERRNGSAKEVAGVGMGSALRVSESHEGPSQNAPLCTGRLGMEKTAVCAVPGHEPLGAAFGSQTSYSGRRRRRLSRSRRRWRPPRSRGKRERGCMRRE